MRIPRIEPPPRDATIKVGGLWTRLAGRDGWLHRGLELEVAPGESVALIGGSGSGKSTLLRQLLGLVRPERGEILLGGLDVTRASEREIYQLFRRVGVLFQFGALFDSMPVWENVTFGLGDLQLGERERIRIAREKLKMVGLRDVEHLLPGALSGGMCKRVALARAIAGEPRILLCDEPTSGLDPVMSDTITELILQMKQRLGVTTLVITHDMGSAYKVADRIAMLYQGHIRVFDTPAAIRDSDDPVVRQFVEGRALGPVGEGEDAA